MSAVSPRRALPTRVVTSTSAPMSPLPARKIQAPSSPLPERRINAPMSPLPERRINAPMSPLPVRKIQAPSSPLPERRINTPMSPLPVRKIQAPSSPLPERRINTPGAPITQTRTIRTIKLPTSPTRTPVPSSPLSNKTLPNRLVTPAPVPIKALREQKITFRVEGAKILNAQLQDDQSVVLTLSV